MTAFVLLVVLLLILLNGFFVIAEYALVRSSKSRLEADAAAGKRGARLAVRQYDELSDYISAVQVGVTLTSLGVGAVGEPAVAHALEDPLGSALAHGAAVAIAVVIGYLIISSMHIVIGELVPKLYAIGHAEGVARRVARPLQFFRILFTPFIVVLNAAAHGILRVLGTDVAKLREEGGTPDEIKRIIAESYTGGKLDPSEATMLVGVFHLHEQEARQVMTPIPAVVTVDLSDDVESALRRCTSTGHTRLVVTEDENPDRVKGIVHVNALTNLLLKSGPESDIGPVVREAPIVPETKPLDDLLAELQRQRASLAIVVDEYGRTAGIVTVEDVIEEIVGEIDDETDPLGGAVRRLGNGDWFVRGHVAVRDLEDYGLTLPVDSDAYNSVGGFVFDQLGRLPKRGDTVRANGYSIRVESVRENRIEAVRISERRPAGRPAAT